MNILREIAQARHKNAKKNTPKKQNTYMTRVRLPTQAKSKKCGICGKAGKTLRFGRETRILCIDHIKQLNMKNESIPVIFEKAKLIK